MPWQQERHDVALKKPGQLGASPARLDPDAEEGGLDAAGLLLVDLDHVVLLHLQRLGCLVVVDPSAVEQEAERGHGHPHLGRDFNGLNQITITKQCLVIVVMP